MRRTALVLGLALAAASCSGSAAPTTTGVAPTIATTTSTTIDVRLCEDLADQAVAWVGDLVTELEGIRYEVLVDRTRWPESLVAVDEAGAALQADSDAAGCDEALIRGAVVSAASQMQSDSATSSLLLELLAPSGEEAPSG